MSFETYGRYQLLKKLATGGMAEIYLARELPQGAAAALAPPGVDERLLVIKRILAHLTENEEFVRMFLDEARIAARLHHPNVVQVFDLGAEGGSYFIAMEYIHGEDVRRVWRQAEAEAFPMPPELACRIIADACRGLRYAHKRTDAEGKALGIVHRDVSPQNILVTFRGEVKVVDFGIAKATGQTTSTRSGVLKGKYSYMSPEQAQGQRLDARSDIFALGTVLWELLTGTRLFKRSTELQTLDAVIQCAVASPSSLNATLPASLDAIVLKALARDPQRRYQKASELQHALELWLRGQSRPASQRDLAAFMERIYAVRLAREREEGMLLLEGSSMGGTLVPGEVDRAEIERHSSRRTPIMPRGADPRSEPPFKAPPSLTARGPDLSFSTVALPRGSPGRRGSGPFGVGTLTLGLVLGVGTFLAAGAAAFRFLPSTPPAARVLLSTVPPGASLLFDGRVRLTTPALLPRVRAGTYSLTVTAPGYRERTGRVHIPPTGDVSLDPIHLEPIEPAPKATHVEEERPPPPGPGRPQESPPSMGTREAKAMITVMSIPAGARLRVNGTPRGTTPAVLQGVPGTTVGVRLEHRGFHPLTAQLTFAPEALTRSLRLEALRPSGAARAASASAGAGRVRFVVRPLGTWAEVSCDGHKLGTTPMPDPALAPGTHACELAHPQLGVRRQQIQVRSGETTRVTVDF